MTVTCLESKIKNWKTMLVAFWISKSANKILDLFFTENSYLIFFFFNMIENTHEWW